MTALIVSLNAGRVPREASINWVPFTFTSAAGDTVAADSARVEVAENRSKPNGSKIQLAVVRIRSTSTSPGAPIVYLAGGPGGAGIAGVRGELFPTVLAFRKISDVLLFDQRGTGVTLPSLLVRKTFGVPLTVSSSAPEAMTAFLATSRDAVAEMRTRGIDLASYNTRENADDLDDIRKSIGAEKIIVWGHSYGSHLGLAYIRQHGAHTERAIFGGINGLDHRRRFPRDGDALFQRIDSAVKATPALREVMPDFLGSTRRAFARLDTQPATIRVDSQDVLVTRDDVQRVIAILSGEQGFVRRLPWLIGRLEAGDYTFMARLVRDVIKSRPLGTAMTYAMDLASGASAARTAKIRSQVESAILGNAINYPFDDPAFQAAWAIPDLGDAFRLPVKSPVPVLLISGNLDGRTSLGDAEEVKRGFASSAHVIVNGASHNPYATNPELQSLMVRFAKGERVRNATLQAAGVEFRGPDETAIIEELRRIASETGIAASVQRMRELARPGSQHYVSSFVISGAFQAIASQDKPGAHEFLKAGIELLPANSALLTRLAEAEVARGDKVAAAAAYRRAIGADPFNRLAVVQLGKLEGSP